MSNVSSQDLLEDFSVLGAETFLQQLSNSALMWEDFETTCLMHMLDSPKTFIAPIENISIKRH